MVAKNSTKQAKKTFVVAPVVVEPVVQVEEEDTIEVTFDDSAILDGIDSSDDEQEQFAPIPQNDTIASNSAIVTLTSDTATSEIKKAKKTKKVVKEIPGSIYLGRIPLGFYENEMRSYFSQFGVITRLRLSRNKKTGASKHYAFIEFASEDVARIVAETMNNYLIFGHIMKCKLLTLLIMKGKTVAADQLHADVYKNADIKYRAVPWVKLQRASHNRVRTTEEVVRNAARVQTKDEAKKAKLAAMGIKFDFPTKVVC